MRQLIVVFILLYIPTSLSAQKAKADTNFILREFTQGSYHAVFIEKDTASPYYDRLTDFSWNEFDSASYESSLKWIFKDQSLKMTHHIVVAIKRNWCQLYEYNGLYYLYAPSDWGNVGRVSINDSTFIQYNMDGPFASLITTCWGRAPKSLDIDLAGATTTLDYVRVHNINLVAGIVLFEYHSKAAGSRFELMVSAEKAKYYPIIVNYSHDRKMMEFALDTLNVTKVFEMQR